MPRLRSTVTWEKISSNTGQVAFAPRTNKHGKVRCSKNGMRGDALEEIPVALDTRYSCVIVEELQLFKLLPTCSSTRITPSSQMLSLIQSVTQDIENALQIVDLCILPQNNKNYVILANALTLCYNLSHTMARKRYK